MMIRLSEKQKQIVESRISAPIQVLASAGAGKTRVLTERVRYILQQRENEGVIALTFTNKAAEEMKSRLLDSDEAAERAWIATIHSVAQRMLGQYGHTIGLPSELQIYEKDQDRMEVFIQSLRDGRIDIDEYLNVDNSKEKRNRERQLQQIMNRFSLIKREMLNRDEVANDELWDKFNDYQSALLDSGGIDFDDILYYANRLLLTHDWIARIYRTKFPNICVDEAQDLNRLQYEFIKALCGEATKSVMMVGDPNQMIYGFNGSSSEYLCDHFPRDFSAIKFELIENFRSTTEVIKAANSLKPSSQMGLSYALRGKFQVEVLDDEEKQAEWIVSSVQNFINLEYDDEIEGPITLDNMVVIARNRFVFSSLEKTLSDHSIPFYLRKSERADDPISLFGKILDHSIRIKLNPKDWIDGKKLCSILNLNPPDTWTNERILAVLADQIPDKGLQFPDVYSDLLKGIDKLDADNPNIREFEEKFKNRLAKLAALDHDDNSKLELERSIDELRDFSVKWTKFKQKGLGYSLQHFRNALALGQLAEEVSTNGLMLSTVHTMKGLEKDIVFIISMCEGVFPDYRATSDKKIAEELNNAFVAITRAKRWLFITYPNERTMPWGDKRRQTPSRFITKIEKSRNENQQQTKAARAARITRRN